MAAHHKRGVPAVGDDDVLQRRQHIHSGLVAAHNVQRWCLALLGHFVAATAAAGGAGCCCALTLRRPPAAIHLDVQHAQCISLDDVMHYVSLIDMYLFALLVNREVSRGERCGQTYCAAKATPIGSDIGQPQPWVEPSQQLSTAIGNPAQCCDLRIQLMSVMLTAQAVQRLFHFQHNMLHTRQTQQEETRSLQHKLRKCHTTCIQKGQDLT